MHRSLSIGLVFVLATAFARAADIPDLPVVYHEGFENGPVKWRLWVTNATKRYTPNHLGPSTDHAVAGKHSLKIDWTTRDGSYCYWCTRPLKIPCTGDLKLSGYLYVDRLPPGMRVGIGYNIIFPPSGQSGCGTISTVSSPSSKWQYFELNLASTAARKASSLLGTQDVYCYLDRIAIMFLGKFKPGQRVVVYVDELKVTGHIPEQYEARLRERVERANARHIQQVKAWAKQVAATSSDLKELQSQLTALPEPVRNHAKNIAEATARTANQFAVDAKQFLQRGRWLLRGQDQQWKEKLATVQSGIETLRQLLAQADRYTNSPLVIYTRKPICDDRILPNQLPIPAALGDTVELTATPGEYEPGTCVLFACSELSEVRLDASDLQHREQTIPSSAIDMHIVKTWYQNGISTIGARKGQRLLVPELLLYDDALIRVDYKNHRNFMRQQDQKGHVTYVDISDPNPAKMPDVLPRDAAQLQPFNIPAGQLKQIWITVHVPEQALAGDYQGTIRVTTGRQTVGTIHLRLHVLPFHLCRPQIMQAIYYGAKLRYNPAHFRITASDKNQQQLEAELRDMAVHGIVAPTTYQPYDSKLETVLKIRNRVGLDSGPLFTLGQTTGNATDPAKLQALQQAVKKWLKVARKYGYDNVYFYGLDEARDLKLISQRAAWKAVREAGGKTFVAGYQGSFEAIGDLQDLLVMAGRPDPNEAAKYHRIGHLIYSYANPQCGCEQPERYRRNYGLLLWKSNFDGAMDFAYQWAFGHIWNDFDSARYRDHVMAYPTVDGVIDTVQWEGYREGVDDTRYLATLLTAIDNAPPNKADIATSARRWLNDLDINGDLDAIRAKMIAWILKLH